MGKLRVYCLKTLKKPSICPLGSTPSAPSEWVDLALMRDNWYHHWVAGATLDDQLWHQALVMDRVLESLRGSEQGPNDAMMWTLLRRGIIDADVVDKPWNGSTRSMRYSAVLVGRLWGLLAGERTRVSLYPSFL